MSIKKPPPQLEERFTAPPNWTTGTFTRHGRCVHFGGVVPANTPPKATVICLPGLSEFSEKYYEIAREMLARGMAFYVIDWVFQGRSMRHHKNPHKRHSHGFKEDIADLHMMISEHTPSELRTKPLIMLAHSMGGHIGLRYLHHYPDTFKAAAFSAPMIGILGLKPFPAPVARSITTFMRRFASSLYGPGTGDWGVGTRAFPGKDGFSSDPVRGAVHNAWCLHDKALQVGNITWRWLHEARRSCRLLRRKSYLSAIKTPCIVASAGHDLLVDNDEISRAVELMPHATLLKFPKAYHEILMERDEIRGTFFEAFDQLILENIPEIRQG